MDTIVMTNLDGGLTLLVEPVPNARSAAVTWRIPAGSARDAADSLGECALFEEFLYRGAGGMTSKEHSDALDRIGVRRDSSVGSQHLTFSATMLGANLLEALPLIVPVATDLALEADALHPARQLCLQAIEALPDDPQHLAILRVREHHLPPPFGRTGLGEPDHLARISIEQLRDAWQNRCVPGGSILGIAGAVNPAEVHDAIAKLVAGWAGAAETINESGPSPRGTVHVHSGTAQTHIAMAYDAPAEPDPHSVVERIGIAVLSGGMSGRLFTEVRERRSLCYSVNAGYRAGRDRGLVTVYAGTTPDRAQETLDVTIEEISRLREGVGADEFRRAVIGLKSRLVMQGESTAGRAAGITSDYFRLGRARTLDEIAQAIDRITVDELNEYLSHRETGEMTIATVGPEALVPVGEV